MIPALIVSGLMATVAVAFIEGARMIHDSAAKVTGSPIRRDDHPSHGCSSLWARLCPIHGACTCTAGLVLTADDVSTNCPLHGFHSLHPRPARTE
jgi:hypothetical protein